MGWLAKLTKNKKNNIFIKQCLNFDVITLKIITLDIKNVIQQKKSFASSYHRASVNLIYTHNWVKDRIKQQLKPFGITMQQFNVLRILKGAEQPISTSVIRERLLDKMADTSRMVERLAQKELVVKCTCPNDKRLVDVALSKKGKQLVEQLLLLQPKIDQILSNLSEEEAAQLSNLLDKIRG